MSWTLSSESNPYSTKILSFPVDLPPTHIPSWVCLACHEAEFPGPGSWIDQPQVLYPSVSLRFKLSVLKCRPFDKLQVPCTVDLWDALPLVREPWSPLNCYPRKNIVISVTQWLTCTIYNRTKETTWCLNLFFIRRKQENKHKPNLTICCLFLLISAPNKSVAAFSIQMMPEDSRQM